MEPREGAPPAQEEKMVVVFGRNDSKNVHEIIFWASQMCNHEAISLLINPATKQFGETYF